MGSLHMPMSNATWVSAMDFWRARNAVWENRLRSTPLAAAFAHHAAPQAYAVAAVTGRREGP